MTEKLEAGFTIREWGQPGDPRPTRVVFGGATKLQLVSGTGGLPSVAVDASIDRIGQRETIGSRAIASAGLSRAVWTAGYVGAEKQAGESLGVTWGVAAALPIGLERQLVLDVIGGPRGTSIGSALLWRVTPSVGVYLAANYLPSDSGFRVSGGLTLAPPAPRRPMAPAAAVVAAEPREEVVPAAALRHLEPRPRFRLRMAQAGPDRFGQPRRLQHGPYAPSAAVAAAPAVAPAVRAAAPTLEDLAEAQLRDQEALAEARERRVRATSDQLDGREKAAQDETMRLEQRERELAAREQQLQARDKRIAVRGTPTQQERNLQSLELQLASQERSLVAQARSYDPAIDAARGRERSANIRETVERQEAIRLAASASGAATRALQLELRKQALAARNRQLAALEARLVAKGELIDALERQSRLTGERLDAWQRRLDAMAERLDLLERRLAEPRPAAASAPKPAGAVAAPKDKAVFVMVVKSPTSIVKERGASPAAAAVAAPLHPGVAVEKAVAAATVITFSSPASQLSELDRETVDNIARLAAKENCELLVWARAKDPSLMAEAQRRAAEIKARVVAAGPLDEKQVVTRITTRPGANGVDVVVSALRETAKPAAPAPAAAAAAPGGPTLEGGEAGKRQIREAVQAAQSSIEACVAEVMERRKLARAEGVLKLTVATSGKVAKVASEGDLAGTGVAECLGASATGWVFPRADAEYVVDVPITVMRGGTQP
ncbi:MAG TPA: hypothetical protein VFL83_21445 [Anaeromyxobacter sp.]|nr:hypothetical protein [Anaeromyxobacter sp.]